MILGTANSIAGQQLNTIKFDTNLCPGDEQCALLPSLTKGAGHSQEVIERLYDEIKAINLSRTSPGPTLPRRPIRAIYVHDVQIGDTQDDTQHKQLDFAVGLMGQGNGKPAQLVRYGPEQPLPRKERIQKRWKKAFNNLFNGGPLERDVQDNAGLSQDVVADLINAGDQLKQLRFEKQLDRKGLKKTDLWNSVA